MTRQRYPETFKIEAVKQITERGRPVTDIVRALGVSSHSLYAWHKHYGKPADQQHEESALQSEIRLLQREHFTIEIFQKLMIVHNGLIHLR